MDTPRFAHSSADGCFLTAIENKVAMNMDVQMPEILISFLADRSPEVVLLDPAVVLFLSFF